jgi:predicted ArsR family transcriptional regulator
VTTARQRVYAQLKKARAASTREIARALKMSAPTVRHHLAVLCSDGRATVSARKPARGRGRPEKLYSLSEALLGDNLSGLVAALLTEAKLKPEAVAGRILDPDQFAGLPINKRLPLLIEKLNEMNYQARWEAGASGPRVIFGRCPYARVIDGHPELCKMDAVILQGSLGKPVEGSIKTDTRTHGLCPFLFHIG